MRNMLVCLIGAFLLAASPVMADLTLGPGGSATFIRENGQTEKVGDLFAEVEYSVNLDEMARHWLGLMAAYDGDEFAGLGLRYYISSAGGAIYPGLGISAYTLGADTVDQNTVLVGGEVLLEMRVGIGSGALPLKAFVGWYPAVDGAEVTMYRFGLTVTPELLQE